MEPNTSICREMRQTMCKDISSLKGPDTSWVLAPSYLEMVSAPLAGTYPLAKIDLMYKTLVGGRYHPHPSRESTLVDIFQFLFQMKMK